MGWLNVYQISIEGIINRFISQYGSPETDEDWQQLQELVTDEYEARRLDIALKVKQDYQNLQQDIPLVNEMDNVIIEKAKVPVISKTKNKAKSLSLRKQQQVLIDILGRSCHDCGNTQDLQIHYISSDKSTKNAQVLCSLCYKKRQT